MNSKLFSISDTISFIEKGHLLSLAGDEKLLSQLPKGNWIGGTIPYFMDTDKVLFTQDKIYVNQISKNITNFRIRIYNDSSIYNIVEDSYTNGFTILILPPFQSVQRVYALESLDFNGIYNNPIVGWIVGKDFDSNEVPKIYNGQNSQAYEDKAIAMHLELSEDKTAKIDVINVFEKDFTKPEITFLNSGLDIHDCIINGNKVNLAQYIFQNKIDTRLPLMSSHKGIEINVSIKDIDNDFNIVSFFAPVFNDRKYFFSKHISNYSKRIPIKTLIDKRSEMSFLCILNYLHNELSNKTINNVTGPFTFGEIAYHLLNQTIVSLKILDKKNDEYNPSFNSIIF